MKAINVFLKVVYWTSVLLIAVCIICQIAMWVLPLELSGSTHEVYDTMRFYGFTLAVILTLTGTVKQTDSSSEVARKVSLTLLVAGACFFLMVLSAFSGMCGWSIERVYFENRQNPSVKIVERWFDCGATDGGGMVRKAFKMTVLSGDIIWVNEIDTNAIDKSSWKRL
jgi:hypothetical protein